MPTYTLEVTAGYVRHPGNKLLPYNEPFTIISDQDLTKSFFDNFKWVLTQISNAISFSASFLKKTLKVTEGHVYVETKEEDNFKYLVNVAPTYLNVLKLGMQGGHANAVGFRVDEMTSPELCLRQAFTAENSWGSVIPQDIVDEVGKFVTSSAKSAFNPKR